MLTPAEYEKIEKAVSGKKTFTEAQWLDLLKSFTKTNPLSEGGKNLRGKDHIVEIFPNKGKDGEKKRGHVMTADQSTQYNENRQVPKKL